MPEELPNRPRASQRQRLKTAPLGCWHTLRTGLILIFLLICDILFVKAFLAINLAGFDDRIFQAAQFILPFFLIFLQFWLYDRFRNWFDPPDRDLRKKQS